MGGSFMSIKKINQMIRDLITKYVSLYNGTSTSSAIDYVIKTLILPNSMSIYLTRQRVAGNVSALVTKFEVLDCRHSSLYI